MNQSINRIPILMAIAALAALVFAPTANATTSAPIFSSAFGIEGTGDGQFKSPQGSIVFDSVGNAWVADTLNDRIQKFNSKGKYLSKFGTKGSGNGQFENPIDIELDAVGNLWVADTENHRIQKFDSEGKYLLQFGTEGSGIGQLGYPRGIAIDSEGNIWVSDSANSRIQKFNSEGKYLSQFGKTGAGNGQFSLPDDIDIDSEGNIWVADRLNHRIQKFNSKGEYLLQFGTKGSGNGQFKLPRGLAFGPEGLIWVTDRENYRVQGLTTKGEYVTQFGTKGSGPGQFSGIMLGHPAVDSAGYIWVTDSGNDRVQVWARPWRIEGKTLAELGIKEEKFVSIGTYKIEILTFPTSFNCKEIGSGTIYPAGSMVYNMTLSCERPDGECVIDPFEMSVDRKFDSLGEKLFVTSPKEGCFSNTKINNGSGFFDIGSEAKILNVTGSHTTYYGAHKMYITGSSLWQLVSNKTFGLW